MTEEAETYEKAVCCHCGGLGCTYCDKLGFVLVKRPLRKCRHCNGECCIYCGFTGWEDVKGKYD
jgi:hypothetical protein